MKRSLFGILCLILITTAVCRADSSELTFLEELFIRFEENQELVSRGFSLVTSRAKGSIASTVKGLCSPSDKTRRLALTVVLLALSGYLFQTTK